MKAFPFVFLVLVAPFALANDLPDYLSLSCQFEHPSGSQSMGYRPSEGGARAEAQASDGSAYFARCGYSRAGGWRKSVCAIGVRANGRETVLDRKQFDPSNILELTLEGGHVRLTCRANS